MANLLESLIQGLIAPVNEWITAVMRSFRGKSPNMMLMIVDSGGGGSS
jgi:hypothetical protein